MVMLYRLFGFLYLASGLWCVFKLEVVASFLGFGFLMRYGNRVKHKKIKPLLDPIEETQIDTNRISDIKLTSKHIKILVTLVVGYSGILTAVQLMGWGRGHEDLAIESGSYTTH